MDKSLSEFLEDVLANGLPGHLLGANPDAVMTWLVSNPNTAEQRSDLLLNLKTAADPMQAAALA